MNEAEIHSNLQINWNIYHLYELYVYMKFVYIPPIFYGYIFKLSIGQLY